MTPAELARTMAQLRAEVRSQHPGAFRDHTAGAARARAELAAAKNAAHTDAGEDSDG